MVRELKNSMAPEVITTMAELESLQAQWRALWSAASRTTPFQSPEWLIPWWRNFANGNLALLAIRRRGRLLALFPWMMATQFAASERGVCFLGSGTSDYQDALVENGMEAETWRSACLWLAQLSRPWVCRLEHLPAASPLCAAAVPGDWQDSTIPQDYCPVLMLSAAGIGASIPAHQSINLRYYRKRAEKLGAVEIRQASESNLADCLSDFFRLHALRWKKTAKDGALHDPTVVRFHRESAAALLQANLLRLYVLRIRGRSVAALYALSHRRRFYYYLGGFDPEFNSISPSTLLIGHAIERAILEGAEEFDFLRGREAYKYSWGAKDQTLYRRIIWTRAAATERFGASAGFPAQT